MDMRALSLHHRPGEKNRSRGQRPRQIDLQRQKDTEDLS